MWELEHQKQEKEKERLLKADREAKAAEALKGGPTSGLGTTAKMSSTTGGSYKTGHKKKPNDEILEYFKAQP